MSSACISPSLTAIELMFSRTSTSGSTTDTPGVSATVTVSTTFDGMDTRQRANEAAITRQTSATATPSTRRSGTLKVLAVASRLDTRIKMHVASPLRPQDSPMQNSLEDFLEAPDGASKVLAHARLLLRLTRLYQTIAPAHLAAASHLANYKSGIVVIHATSGAVATKLKQLAPTLADGFSRKGIECNGVQVKVQARESGTQSRTSTPRTPESERQPQPERLARQPARVAATRGASDLDRTRAAYLIARCTPPALRLVVGAQILWAITVSDHQPQLRAENLRSYPCMG